ncbi:MAG: agmatinase [Bacteroidetes bacterium]|nr:agmatinase [Bacteroidota bacterium]MBU1678899.1 agmatinase [Bacteroidota bacterium]MBU2505995.1 agmatinase [Bacteroidota bacterium]
MKVLSKSNNFLGIPKKYSSFKNSEIVVLSAPLEMTVSYGKGTGLGPKKILEASHYVEFYDEETNREICFDLGIAALEELNFKNLSHKAALRLIREIVEALIKLNKFVVTLGGEHSISSAPAKAYSTHFENLSILQFDAHSDLRESYEGSKYSHASVMKRIAEFNTDITQIGIRAQSKEEAVFIKDAGIKTFYARDIREGKNSKNWQKKVLDGLKENVYITFDVDGLDPSIINATGTPEPGGLLWDETMDLLKLIGKNRNIVGFDVVELAPDPKNTSSDFNTAKLIYKIINYAFSK